MRRRHDQVNAPLTPDKQALVLENLGVIRFVMRWYMPWVPWEYQEDFRAEAALWLCRCANTYDGQCKFATWAIYVLRHKMPGFHSDRGERHYDDRHEVPEAKSLDEPIGRVRKIPRGATLLAVPSDDRRNPVVDTLLEMPDREGDFLGGIAIEENHREVGRRIGIRPGSVRYVFKRACAMFKESYDAT